EMPIQELAAAGAACDRVARGAHDRDIAVAGKDAVVAAGIDDAVIAVRGGENEPVGRQHAQALIARGRGEAAGAAGVGDDLEVEAPRNWRQRIVRVRRHTEVDGLTARENVVVAARY